MGEREFIGVDGSSSGQPSFGDVEHLKGFRDLRVDLSQETRDLVLAMRGLFQATGLSLREFESVHHFSPASVSRYLKGDRIPDKQFLDVLMKSACLRNGWEEEVIPDELQAHLYQRHRDALLSDQPARYREQMASDRLEDAVLEREQAELRIHDLEGHLFHHRLQLGELKERIREIETACAREQRELGTELDRYRRQRADLEVHCDRLGSTIEELEASLAEAVRERDEARMRCAELETELAAAEESTERERLERLVAEERLREAEAAGTADRHRADLEAARREAEEQARQIIEEATNRVTRIRPSVVSRSAALRQLRDEVLHFADVRLPQLAERWSRGHPEAIADDIAAVKPIGIHTKDEIGEVARAIDRLKLLAARITADQALLRAVFGRALDRQKALIEALDESEQTHRREDLASRLLRSSETLQILAGELPSRRWDGTVPLVDVLRLASREVEHDERIDLSDVPEAEIQGLAATCLVHVLAELLENAAKFSAPSTKVRVEAVALPDGRIMIEIHDQGIGLTADDFHDINQKLANRPMAPDADTSQRMGLFVVGVMCHPFGIRAQLRPGAMGGTTSLVMLPDWMTGLAAPEHDYTPGRHTM